MTEVTPPLENTRFSSIFEYNRFMTPPLSPGAGFARMKKRPDFSESPGAALIYHCSQNCISTVATSARVPTFVGERVVVDVPEITPVLTAQAMASRAQSDTLA